MNSTTLSHTDAYKLSHDGFMDEKTEFIYSNETPRGSKYLPVLKEFYDNKSVFFGLQFFIKEYLINEWNEKFFSKPKEQVIKQFKRRVDAYLGKDAISMDRFELLHDLGYLPIRIKALPEGSRVNEKVPYFTVINTDSRFAWLTNYLETIISCETWKPCVTATIGYEFRKMLNKFAFETTNSIAGTDFQMHGFEFRGMSGRHDAAISGAGLLLSTLGTDTVPAIDLLEDYYNANVDNEPVAFSVPASEHSVSSLGAALESEVEFFRTAITKKYPTGIVSLVADTYDFFRAITEYATALKEDILNRKPNALGLAKVVFRPDSGNPVDIVCGDPGAPVGSPQYKGAIECLWDIFGGTITDQGFKVLNERVGLIYGDSITQKIAFDILTRLKEKGFASTNIVFGVGSFTLNYLTRDCLSIAIKATWAQVDGVGYNIFKDPVTDNGTKKSARGLLRVDRVGSDFVLKDQCTAEEEAGGELKVVFENGKLIKDYTLQQVRNNLAQYV
jgi:nicotinamide phosphoribosyltransferase